MIVLLTDFGANDPYIGQLHAAILKQLPTEPIVNLFSDLPVFSIKSIAYLLPAYIDEFAAGAVFLVVVDPGVGSTREVALIELDGRYFIGPDNGVFDVIIKRALAAECQLECFNVLWRPQKLSNSFHARDWFVPLAIKLLNNETIEKQGYEPVLDLPDDLYEIIYIDHYGNAFTGLRGEQLAFDRVIHINNCCISYARVFSEVPAGELFWYVNANGLVEIAANQGSAANKARLTTGMEFTCT